MRSWRGNGVRYYCLSVVVVVGQPTQRCVGDSFCAKDIAREQEQVKFIRYDNDAERMKEVDLPMNYIISSDLMAL